MFKEIIEVLVVKQGDDLPVEEILIAPN